MIESIRKAIVHHLTNVLFTDFYPKQKLWLINGYRVWMKGERFRNFIRYLIWRWRS